MSNIQKYFSTYLPRQQKGLAWTIFEEFEPQKHNLELSISIENKNVNIKELSAYLNFIYRTDGLMSSMGYEKYVHNYNEQIKINEVKLGSWIIVLEQALETIDADKLTIIWLALKYLATASIAIGTPALLYYNILNKREDYLEKRDRRVLKRHIRELIEEELNLSKLDKKQKSKLNAVLEEIFIRNKKTIAAASRFAHKSIRSLNLNIKENHK